MSSSTWLDIGVVAIAILFAVSGWRRGAIAAGLAFFGVVLGAVAGILIAPHVLVHISEGRWRAIVGIGLVILLVIIGEMAGMVLGSAARGVMISPGARALDSTIGAVLQAIGVIVAAWLLAVPLTHSSMPQIASAVTGSRVLGDVNEVAPSWLRAFPRQFADLLDPSGLPDVIGPVAPSPIVPVDPPDPGVLQTPVAGSAAAESVLRIHGIASSCQRALRGPGFVVATERVVTNAHVVAGTSSISVDTAQGALKAQVGRAIRPGRRYCRVGGAGTRLVTDTARGKGRQDWRQRDHSRLSGRWPVHCQCRPGAHCVGVDRPEHL